MRFLSRHDLIFLNRSSIGFIITSSILSREIFFGHTEDKVKYCSPTFLLSSGNPGQFFEVITTKNAFAFGNSFFSLDSLFLKSFSHLFRFQPNWFPFFVLFVFLNEPLNQYPLYRRLLLDKRLLFQQRNQKLVTNISYSKIS